jgi:checkpoint serine/threonine-protein kinase
MRDVFTDDHGKPQPRPTHERAKSYHDSAASAPPFKPFVDESSGIRTPFKVFSRPPEQGENAVTPGNNPVFTPFKEISRAPPSAFTPFEDVNVKEEPKAPSPPPRTPSWSTTVVEIPDDESELEQYQDDYQYDDEDDNGLGVYLPLDQEQEVYEDIGDESYQVPLGGRFGQFTVMTPITERTFEYTTSTTARSSTFGGTPSRVLGQVDEDEDTGGSAAWRDEQYAADAAEQLVAELQDQDEDYDEELPHPCPQQSNGALRLLDTLKLSSNFKPPNPCNPFDRDIMSALLALSVPDQYFYDMREGDANMLDALQKFAKRARKTSGNTSNNTGVLDGSWYPLNIGGHRFSVCEKLGEGGFGAVFKAKDLGTQEQDDTDDEDEDDEDGSSMVALKVVKPRNLWEYRVLRRLHPTIPPHLRRSVVLPHALFAFRDESYLVMDLCSQGTLLNIVNGANAASLSQAGGTLDELLVMFFAVELLRVVEAMHNAGFIHGDLKIDNCLLRLEDVPGGPAAWSSMYSPTGEDGWSCKGLKLIDFGRTIDTRLFPSGQQFIADWDTDARDCFELREQRPWTYQTDYFGLAGIIYCMLFGKYIEANSVSTKEGRHKIDTPLKRYWQTEIWERLFAILLNPCAVRDDATLPLCSELAEIRGQMEAWLQAHCNRASNTLKGLLKKIQVLCI